jgi:ABC-type transporter Mla subunit MlaD
MKPQNQSGDENFRPPGQQFPPGLEFLSALRKAAELEGEEKIALLWTFLQNVRDFSERLRQHGLDPDLIVTNLQPKIERLAKSEREVEESQERLLQTAADVGDSMRNLVDGLEAAINVAAEDNPFHPDVQEWKEDLEELRKQYPKIE